MPRGESRPRFLGILQDYLPRTYFLMTRMRAAESLMQGLRIGLAVLRFMKPITGIVGCCARSHRPRDHCAAHELDEFPPPHVPPVRTTPCAIFRA